MTDTIKYSPIEGSFFSKPIVSPAKTDLKKYRVDRESTPALQATITRLQETYPSELVSSLRQQISSSVDIFVERECLNQEEHFQKTKIRPELALLGTAVELVIDLWLVENDVDLMALPDLKELIRVVIYSDLFGLTRPESVTTGITEDHEKYAGWVRGGQFAGEPSVFRNRLNVLSRVVVSVTVQ